MVLGSGLVLEISFLAHNGIRRGKGFRHQVEPPRLVTIKVPPQGCVIITHQCVYVSVCVSFERVVGVNQ